MFIERKENVVEIGNDFLVRKFKIHDNKLLPMEIVNKRTEEEISFIPKRGSAEFVISILIKKKKKDFIISSDLELDNINIDNQNGKLCFTFLPYEFHKIVYNIKLCYEIKDSDHFMRKYLIISSSNDEKVVIDYIDIEHLILSGDEKQIWSRPDMDKAYLCEYHSALGQPVYINGLFMGNEFPVSDNNIVNNVASIRYYSGRTLAKMKKGNNEYTTWKSVMGSARSLQMEVIRADFLEYIRSISQKLYLRTQYNSWYDHMMEITAENIRGSFYEIEKGLTQNGVKPVHSYVVDDGWNDYDKDFWCFNNKFPNELYESSELAKKFSSDFGLWMGPRGGYNYNAKLGKAMEKSGKGGYNKQARDVCIADHRYVENITEFFLDYMKKFDINYWKLDGFMITPCKSKKHGHVTGGFYDTYVMVECWEKWIDIFEKMRDLRDSEGKSLWLNQTSYCNASPWFLQWSESLWMQNSGDIGFVKRTNKGIKLSDTDFDAMLTYRDDKYFDFHKVREYQFPLSNMYNHEPIYGNTAKITMTDDEFRKYMYMISTRGTAFWELYYSFNLFSQNMWKINADVLKFVEQNFHILRNAKLIGDTPAKGAVYGYAAFDGSEGIVSVRNPSNYDQSFSFTLDRLIGVKEDAKDMTRATIIPYTEKADEKTYYYGSKVAVNLAPHEIIIFKFGEKEKTAPVLTTQKFVSDTEVELTFDKHIVINKDSFKVNGKSLSSKLLANYNEVKVTFESSQANGTIKFDYSVLDVYGNNAIGSVDVTCYENNVISTDTSKGYEGKGDFTISAKLQKVKKDGILFTQGNDIILSINNGKLVFDCKGVKAKSNTDITQIPVIGISAMREKNGMVKLYINKNLDCSGFDEKNINPLVKNAEIKMGAGLESFEIINKALAFNEI